MPKAKPVHEVRLGRIKAAIWRNDTQNGPLYNVTIVRLYKDGNQCAPRLLLHRRTDRHGVSCCWNRSVSSGRWPPRLAPANQCQAIACHVGFALRCLHRLGRRAEPFLPKRFSGSSASGE